MKRLSTWGKVVVVGDVHGQVELLRSLFEELGVLHRSTDGSLVRNRDTLTISIGDLIDGTKKRVSDDFHTLCVAEDWFDVVCIGNHEYPYLVTGKSRERIAFRKFEHYSLFEEKLLRMEANGILRPSFNIGNWLLTHAGLNIAHGSFMGGEEASDWINQTWQEDRMHPIFSEIPPDRGGLPGAIGGIFWASFEEPKNLDINQVYGHTPVKEVLVELDEAGNACSINIDTGAKEGKALTSLVFWGGKPTEFVKKDPWTIDTYTPTSQQK